MQLSSHRYSSHLYELTAGVLTEWNAHVSSSTNDAGNNKQTRNAKLTQTYLQTKTQKRNSTQFIQIMINLKQKNEKRNAFNWMQCMSLNISKRAANAQRWVVHLTCTA